MVITDVNQITYNGDGVTTAWPFTFEFIDATDIKIQMIDADGARHDITSDYYVDVVNNTVYYPGYAPGSEPPEADQPPKVQSGQKIRVYRKLPVNQLADLGDKWPFYVIEKGLDKLTMLIQDMWGWVGSNIMQLSDTLFKWDAKGYPIQNVGAPASVNDAATKDYVDSILNGFVLAGDSRTVPFDTVAQMRAADLDAAQIATTLGYYDINDGGCGVYAIRAAVPGDLDDGGLIIILNNGNVAELLPANNEINVKQFGAYGDYSHDDTAAFQAALDAGYDVYVPTARGERYIISDTLTISNSHAKRIHGDNFYKFSGHGGIKYTNEDSDHPMFLDTIEGFNIFDLSIEGTNMEGTFFKAHVYKPNLGIYTADIDAGIENCRIIGFRYGFDIIGRGLTVKNNNIANIRVLAVLNWDDSEEVITTHPAKYGQRAIWFDNNRLHAIYSSLVYGQTGHAHGFRFTNNLIDNGRFVNSYIFRFDEEVWNITISNNTIQGAGNPTFFAIFRGGIKDSVIAGNVIKAEADYWNGVTSAFTNFLDIRGCANLTIAGNVFALCSDDAIILRNKIDGLTFTGNCLPGIGLNAFSCNGITDNEINDFVIGDNIFKFASNGNNHYIISAGTGTNVYNSFIKNNTVKNMTKVALDTAVRVYEPSIIDKFNPQLGSGDLNDLTGSNTYVVGNSVTLTNAPVSGPYVLEVVDVQNSSTTFQRITIANKMYTRRKSSGGWGSWYVYEGTVVS